jgi:hypothetical protein
MDEYGLFLARNSPYSSIIAILLVLLQRHAIVIQLLLHYAAMIVLIVFGALG